MSIGYPALDPATCSVVFPYTGRDGEIEYATVTPMTVWQQEDALHATYPTGIGVAATDLTIAAVIPDDLPDDEILAIMRALRAAYDEANGIDFVQRLVTEINTEV